MNPNAVGHPLTATPAINEFTKRNVTGFATRKNARVEYNEYLNFNPSDLTAIFVYSRVINGFLRVDVLGRYRDSCWFARPPFQVYAPAFNHRTRRNRVGVCRLKTWT